MNKDGDKTVSIKSILIAVAIGSLLLVSFLFTHHDGSRDASFINKDHHLGDLLLEFNQIARKQYDISNMTIVLANPTGDLEDFLTPEGERYTGLARQDRFFNRASHPEFGQTGFITLGGGHQLCMTWAGDHDEYETLINRLFARSPISDGTERSVLHHMVAFHELGHCVRPPSSFSNAAIGDNQLKSHIREIIQVSDDVIDRYFTHPSGMSLHQRYLAETFADMFSVDRMIEQAGYDKDEAMNALMTSRHLRHRPGYIEYATSLSLVALHYYERTRGYLHSVDVIERMLKEDPMLELDKVIVGSIAERFNGEYQVIDEVAYEEAKEFFAIRRMHWSEWRAHLGL